MINYGDDRSCIKPSTQINGRSDNLEMYGQYVMVAGLLCGFIYLLDIISLQSMVHQSRIISALADNGCHALCSLFQYFLFQYIIYIHRRPNSNKDDDYLCSSSSSSSSSSIGRVNSNNKNTSSININGSDNGGISIMKIVASIPFKEAILSLLFGSIVDLDHFLAAGSTSLSAATSLKTRPLGHCLCVALPAILTVYWVVNRVLCKIKLEENVKYQLLIGYISHIARDSTKRGIWILFGISTYPIPRLLYLVLFVTIPFVFFFALHVEGKGDIISINRFLDKTRHSAINTLDNV